MRVVPLQATANQSFSATLDGVRWLLTIKESRGAMCADVTRDGAVLLRGVRVVAGEPIIPYAYLQTGNFIFTTVRDAAPLWSQFGVSQILVYVSDVEIMALPAPTAGSYPNATPENATLTNDFGVYITTELGDLIYAG